jgi:hypothetical protein
MYAHFLTAALDQKSPSADALTPGKALANVLQRRSQLADSRRDGSSRTRDALANELEYDIALIRFTRLLGIDGDVQLFDQPQAERSRLERALATRGVHLDDLQAG